MAGESPDRSKQRESSAEPTSGSAGPVPEARTAADEEPGTRGGVDTATRVLSVRDLLTEAEETAETADEEAEAAESARQAAEGGESGDPGGSDDSDDSGAASGGEDAAEDAADGPGAAVTGTEPSGTAETAEEAAEDAVNGDESAAEDADADSDAEAASERQGGDEEDAESARQADAGSGSGGDVSADGEEGEGAPDGPVGDDRLRAAVAAWVRSGDSAGDEKPSAKTDAGSDEADTAAAADAADAEPEPEDAEPEDAEPEDAEPEDAEPEDAEPEDAEPEDAEPEDAVADAVPEPRTGSDEPKPGEGGDPKADAKPDAKPDDSKPDDPKAADAKTDAKPGPEAPKASKDAPAASAQVDQPTAIFKRPKPQVDQPTTMLKLTGQPTSDPERTSKFVALKPLDDPAAKKPKPAPADATASVPQVGPERTTQQPLPPKPPLDLLAELTNTPPPPETPVRTIVRRVKIWTPLVLLLAVVFAIAQAVRPLPAPTLDLTADESYTFDGAKADIPWPASGQGALDVLGIGSFGSSGTQKPVPIASVAKVMTTYLILRDHPLKGDGAKIKVDQTAEEQATADGESTVEVKAGDTITQKEALEGVLIASANNVARLLARWDAGSEKGFVSKMNAAAQDLGMTNTTYTDPSGLQKTTVSTAADQVKLAKAAMKNPSFREIARMMEYTDYKGTRHSNWNRLVGYNGVIGIKTGTTTAAGGNLVFAAVKQVGGETRTIVGAVLGQGPGGSDNTILSGALDASDKLIRGAQGALKSATILKKGDVVGYVDDGLGGRTPVVITKDVSAVGWAGLKVKLSFVASELPHTAKAGAKVGTLTVGDGGTSGAVQVPVALQKDLAEPGFTDKLTRIG